MDCGFLKMAYGFLKMNYGLVKWIRNLAKNKFEVVRTRDFDNLFEPQGCQNVGFLIHISILLRNPL